MLDSIVAEIIVHILKYWIEFLKDQNITIYGDGKQTRSFCYVDDLIDGMIKLMNSPKEFTGPVNMGNPGEFTMLELARKVIALTGSHSEIVYEPLPSDDPMQRKPVIDLAKERLGWEPEIALEEGLKRTIAYFKEVL